MNGMNRRYSNSMASPSSWSYWAGWGQGEGLEVIASYYTCLAITLKTPPYGTFHVLGIMKSTRLPGRAQLCLLLCCNMLIYDAINAAADTDGTGIRGITTALQYVRQQQQHASALQRACFAKTVDKAGWSYRRYILPEALCYQYTSPVLHKYCSRILNPEERITFVIVEGRPHFSLALRVPSSLSPSVRR